MLCNITITKQRRCPRLKGIYFIGYTHYWKIDRNKVNKKAFADAVTKIQNIIPKLPKYSTSAGKYYPTNRLIIRDGDGNGNGTPTFSHTLIRFNGTTKSGCDHETFYIDLLDKDPWDFCKTARKPYDFLACLSLLILAHTVNDNKAFSFTSDGRYNDWLPVLKYYKKHFGDINPNLVPKYILTQQP